MKKQYELSESAAFQLPRKDIDPRLVERCRSFAQALRLCVSESEVKLLDSEIAEMIEMHPTQFSLCLNPRSGCPRFMDGGKVAALMRLCRNNAPLQWINMNANEELLHQQDLDGKERALQAQLEELRRMRRA